MTVERTKELLGDEVAGMSDEEIQTMIYQYTRLADMVFDILRNTTSGATPKIEPKN